MYIFITFTHGKAKYIYSSIYLLLTRYCRIRVCKVDGNTLLFYLSVFSSSILSFCLFFSLLLTFSAHPHEHFFLACAGVSLWGQHFP